MAEARRFYQEVKEKSANVRAADPRISGESSPRLQWPAIKLPLPDPWPGETLQGPGGRRDGRAQEVEI